MNEATHSHMPIDILLFSISLPVVTVTCPSLPNPGNGIVDVRGNQPGDTAVYSCNPGFTLDGEGARTCVEDGEWSGDEPTCISKLAYIVCRMLFSHALTPAIISF